MENNIVGNVNFKFAARFSSLIGRNLISNPIVPNNSFQGIKLCDAVVCLAFLQTYNQLTTHQDFFQHFPTLNFPSKLFLGRPQHL